MTSKPGRDIRPNNGVTLNVDCDGVIADFVGQLVILSAFRFSFMDIDKYDHPLLTKELITRALHEPETYKYLFPVQNARPALRGLYASGYRIHIATNRNPKTTEYLVNWLALWGIPYDDLTLLGFANKDKNVAGGDILVDDKPVNVNSYADAGIGQAILFSQPWNENAWISPAVERVRGWDKTVQAIRRIKEGLHA